MRRDLKIAYLHLAHHQPRHLARLVRSLAGPEARFFVHIDRNRDERPFREALKDEEGVRFVERRRRQRIVWGGYSIVQATLDLIRTAIEQEPETDRFCLLSGSDFPIKTREQIVRELASDTEYIEIKRKLQIGGDRHHDAYVNYVRLADKAPQRLFWLTRLLKLWSPQPPLVPIYHGSQWWCLTRECIDYILDFLHRNAAYCRYHRFLFGPDEYFFHSIVKASPFAARISQDFEVVGPRDVRHVGAHFILWKTRDHPETLDESYWDDLGRSPALFARKFDETRSARVLDMLQQRMTSP